MQEGSGNSDSLFLTAREGISQLSDFRIVALRQSRDKLVNRSLFGSFYDFLPGSIFLSNRNVIGDGIMKLQSSPCPEEPV